MIRTTSAVVLKAAPLSRIAVSKAVTSRNRLPTRTKTAAGQDQNRQGGQQQNQGNRQEQASNTEEYRDQDADRQGRSGGTGMSDEDRENRDTENDTSENRN